MIAELTRGKILTGPVANVAAAVTSYPAFLVSAYAGQVGTRSFRLRKLMAQNNAVGAAVWLRVGTGVWGAFVDMIPYLYVLNNIDQEWQEFDLPRVEFFATLNVGTPVMAAGNVLVTVEVEEIG